MAVLCNGALSISSFPASLPIDIGRPNSDVPAAFMFSPNLAEYKLGSIVPGHDSDVTRKVLWGTEVRVH
eukprot:9500046-Pyramimonas_sp.AAC.1